MSIFPYRVQDNFKQNNKTIIKYCKKKFGYTSKFKLVEHIRFLYDNLHFYYIIINKYENYSILKSIYSLNLINKLLKSDIELRTNFWRAISENKYCLKILSNNIDKLDNICWYHICFIDKELQIIKKNPKICFNNVVSHYKSQIKLAEKQNFFDFEKFWEFLEVNPNSSYIFTNNQNILQDMKEILCENSINQIVRYILSNNNESSYIIQNIDYILKTYDPNVWCKIFSNDKLVVLFEEIIDKHVCDSDCETVLLCINSLFENNNKLSTNFIKTFITIIQNNIKKYKIDKYTFERLFLNSTHTSVFNDVINLHPSACSEPYGKFWLIETEDNADYIIKNCDFLLSNNILSISDFFGVENIKIINFFSKKICNCFNVNNFSNEQLLYLTKNNTCKNIVEKNSILEYFITNNCSIDDYYVRRNCEINNSLTFPFKLLEENLLTIDIKKLKYILSHNDSIDFIVKHFDTLYERFKTYKISDEFFISSKANHIISIIHEHKHGPSFIEKRPDKFPLIIRSDVELYHDPRIENKLYYEDSLKDFVTNKEFVRTFKKIQNLYLKNDNLDYNKFLEIFTWVTIDNGEPKYNKPFKKRANETLRNINKYMYLNNDGIYELDYNYLINKMKIHTEGLVQAVFKPTRVLRNINKYNYDIGNDEYFEFNNLPEVLNSTVIIP